ncbi:hypothetical protein BZM27_06200 [Paraburkholderia steynii]|uniref:Phage lipoprotein n=1 Tax=Paraburkholderia steynii TaxID=1245441 RepID=A0A4R0XPP1_9BURK|nr:hypothetical protein BZM27_06200 [Paraburkholderia steynii]
MKALFIAAAAAGFAMLAGCVSPSTQTLTPAQVATIVCPSVKSELQTLELAGVFTGGAADTLAKQVTPDVDAVCDVGATITDAKLQTLSNAAFPVVLAVVKNSSLSDQDKAKAYLAIGGFQAVINTNIALAQASASAPVAASQ